MTPKKKPPLFTLEGEPHFVILDDLEESPRTPKEQKAYEKKLEYWYKKVIKWRGWRIDSTNQTKG